MVIGSSGSCTENVKNSNRIMASARATGGVSFDGSGGYKFTAQIQWNTRFPGNVATATTATNITATANNSTDETVYLTFVDGATGTQGIETRFTGLNYNPSSGVLTTTSVSGNLTARYRNHKWFFWFLYWKCHNSNCIRIKLGLRRCIF